MFQYRNISAILIVLLVPLSSQIGAQIRTEPPMFLNPKMQKQYEEDSKTASVNVGRAVAAYSWLREILGELKGQGQTLRHIDSQTEPALLKQLDSFYLNYEPGYSSFQSAEGKRWEDIPDSEPVLQFVGPTSVFAIDKNGIEIENFVPDSHIFFNPQMRDLYRGLPPKDQLKLALNHKKYSPLRMLLARLKEMNPDVVPDFDNEVIEDKLDQYSFGGLGQKIFTLANATRKLEYPGS